MEGAAGGKFIAADGAAVFVGGNLDGATGAFAGSKIGAGIDLHGYRDWRGGQDARCLPKPPMGGHPIGVDHGPMVCGTAATCFVFAVGSWRFWRRAAFVPWPFPFCLFGRPWGVLLFVVVERSEGINHNLSGGEAQHILMLSPEKNVGGHKRTGPGGAKKARWGNEQS